MSENRGSKRKRESDLASSNVHEAFDDWVVKKEIKLHQGIKATEIPGKGFGVVALKKLKAGEVLIEIPVKSLITIDSEFAKDPRIPADLSVHGTLAVAWTLNKSLGEERPFKEWEATWPSLEDVQISMPLFWGKEFQDVLPSSAKACLRKQQIKYDKDWGKASHIIQKAGQSEIMFKYNWIMVNSRCYYWHYAKSRKPEKGKSLPADECMALCPYADYFNHAANGSTFYANPRGVSIVSDRTYERGEEVVVSYGAHSNDFLLVEYGFTMDNNDHESITLDHYLIQTFSEEQKSMLVKMGYFGEYGLHEFGVCYRTEIALRSRFCPEEVLLRYTRGENSGSVYQSQYITEVQKLIHAIEDEANSALKKLEEKKYVGPCGDVLRRRWEQICKFLANVKVEV